MTIIQALRADAKHYNYSNGKRWYTHAGFWVGAAYRFGHMVGNLKFPPLRIILLTGHYIINFPLRFLLHVDLGRRSKIGHGLCMHHPQNIIIPSESALGNDVTIYQEVTLGRGPVPGLPKIGNSVILYSGAKVLGGITVGDDCEIGANVVLTKNVPSHSVVSVAPARAIPKDTIERIQSGRQTAQSDESPAGSRSRT